MYAFWRSFSNYPLLSLSCVCVSVFLLCLTGITVANPDKRRYLSSYSVFVLNFPPPAAVAVGRQTSEARHLRGKISRSNHWSWPGYAIMSNIVNPCTLSKVINFTQQLSMSTKKRQTGRIAETKHSCGLNC